MSFIIRPAGEGDLPGILDIYNDAIRRSLAIWKDEPVDLDNRRSWLAERRAKTYPIFVATIGDRVIGYAAASDFRGGSGYRFSCENSVYVRPEFARRGLGVALMEPLIAGARAIGKRSMIAAIGLPNEGSVRLHAGLGFVEVGLLSGIGEKQGLRLDLLLMQLDL
jgi:L-amino acid N-acyltransferase YncA